MDLIDTLYRYGRLSAIDLHFSRFIIDLAGSSDPSLALAAALLCHTSVEGNTCLDLERFAGRVLLDQAANSPAIACPAIEAWNLHLRTAATVGGPGQERPMILDDNNRLYLHRYWQYEKDVADYLLRIAAATTPIASLDSDLLGEGLDRLFPLSTGPETDWQKVSALVALLKQFCVITGGPGTGKTTVVAKILALLLEQAGQGGLSIRLAAPTGKAAAKLSETLKSAKASLNCSNAIRELIPAEAQTVHRLLKPISGASDFHYHAQNPLEVDVVVVDEASMIDLALMAKLIRALPERARLILLGDKDQLASVEAGAVLGDICGGHAEGRFSAQMLDHMHTLTGQHPDVNDSAVTPGHVLQDCVVSLSESYRFAADSGIGAFSRAVNRGDIKGAAALMEKSADDSLKWQPLQSPQDLYKQLKERISNSLRSLLSCKDPVQALELFNRERWLCALREGPWGTKSVNDRVELSAHQLALIRWESDTHPRWYAGRPILITANDYQLGLFNGDIGIALPENNGQLNVFFPGPTGTLRKFPPHRLGDHETAWAMTVHKCQGSEFDHVHLILPDRDTPLLSRELIYTAVTRAKSSVTIYAPQQILAAAVGRRTQRSSGLQDALWGKI